MHLSKQTMETTFVALPVLAAPRKKVGVVAARSRCTIRAISTASTPPSGSPPNLQPQSVFRSAADGFYDRVRMISAEDFDGQTLGEVQQDVTRRNSHMDGIDSSGWTSVDTTIILFRRDLRANFNSGVSLAFKHSAVATLPLYIMDEAEAELLSEDEGSELASAVEQLDASLKELGSALQVYVLPKGTTTQADALLGIANEIGASRIVVEEDYTRQLRSFLHAVEQVMPPIEIATWTANTRLSTPDNFLGDAPQTFKDWKYTTTEPGEESVKKNVVRALPAGLTGMSEEWHDDLKSWAGKGQNNDLEKRLVDDQEACHCVPTLFPISEKTAELVLVQALERAESYQKVDVVRSLLPYTRLGCLSPRRARQVVLDYESRHGRLIGAVRREAAKRTLSALDGLEWHGALAQRDVANEESWQYWKFNGWLSRYKVGGDHTKPALVLIHGFGASSSHWDSNIEKLQEDYEVWALDLVGFGRSQKPPMQYTQALWEANVASFVRRIVQRPCFIAGNSIGGYLTTAFASDFPELCCGAMLLNSAGRLFEPEENEAMRLEPPVAKKSTFQFFMREYRFVRMGVAKVLFSYLQGNIGKTLKKVYPNKQPNTLEKLASDIYRDSSDPGANDVLASGFVLPPPRSLNDLLEKYDGPLLILQGKNDPLNDASGRAKRLKRVYPGAALELIEAGHCPHHEDPEAVNDIMQKWMDRVLMNDTERALLSEKEASKVY